MIEVHIVYHCQGRTVTLARVHDRELLTAAAELAVVEAFDRSREEAAGLHYAFGLLLPELRDAN